MNNNTLNIPTALRSASDFNIKELTLNDSKQITDKDERSVPDFLKKTQHLATYNERLSITKPLEERLQQVPLPTRTLLEKQCILKNMGLPSRIAQNILSEDSHQYNLRFSDAINKAVQWLNNHQDQPAIQLDIIPVQQVG